MGIKKCNDFNLAERHKNYTESLKIAVEKQMKEQPELVEAIATTEARKLYNMHRQVWCEIHRLESFTRLKASKKGILYASINTEHRTEDTVVSFFMSRFPTFVIMIESKGKGSCYIASEQKITVVKKPLPEVLACLESVMPDNEILSTINETDKGSSYEAYEEKSEEIWNKFYLSQFIKERENLRYFHKSMPKKILKNSGLAAEIRMSANSRDLNEFIDASE